MPFQEFQYEVCGQVFQFLPRKTVHECLFMCIGYFLDNDAEKALGVFFDKFIFVLKKEPKHSPKLIRVVYEQECAARGLVPDLRGVPWMKLKYYWDQNKFTVVRSVASSSSTATAALTFTTPSVGTFIAQNYIIGDTAAAPTSEKKDDARQ